MMGSGRNLAPQPAPPSRLSRSPTEATEAIESTEATEATETRGSTTKFPSLKVKVSIRGYSIDGAVCGIQAAERISRLPELDMARWPISGLVLQFPLASQAATFVAFLVADDQTVVREGLVMLLGCRRALRWWPRRATATKPPSSRNGLDPTWSVGLRRARSRRAG